MKKHGGKGGTVPREQMACICGVDDTHWHIGSLVKVRLWLFVGVTAIVFGLLAIGSFPLNDGRGWFLLALVGCCTLAIFIVGGLRRRRGHTWLCALRYGLYRTF